MLLFLRSRIGEFGIHCCLLLLLWFPVARSLTSFSFPFVFCLACRINTVIDNDAVLVLSDGKLVEYAPPSVLLRNGDSHFTKMVRESGGGAGGGADGVTSPQI
jgi:hypothetical protein